MLFVRNPVYATQEARSHMPFDIDSKINEWRELLLDTSKKNRLINFKVGGNGGVALVHPDPCEIWNHLVASKNLTFVWKRDLIDIPPDLGEQEDEDAPQANVAGAAQPGEVPADIASCRHSPRLRPEHLLTALSDKRLSSRLTRLTRNARESLAEQGVAILYVAFGILRWFESADSQVEVRSPLLLVPVRLERENVAAPWRLRAEDVDVLPNDSLWHRLAGEFKLDARKLPDAEDRNDRSKYFGAVQQCVRHQPRWEVLDEVALSTFSFQKLAMWRDLLGSRDLIADSGICRAIAGDTAVCLRPPSDLPQAKDLDRVAHPTSVFHVLDADSSQHVAIAAVTRGASLVLDGPPGTGKSQTIANVIAEFLAAGKTVLFVSEKAAALEVVLSRLQKKRLDDFCLACHSHKANRKEVVTELDRCLKLLPEQVRDSTEDLHRLGDARAELNEYVRELHKRRDPLGMSFFEAQGELARLARLPSKSVCPLPDVVNRDQVYLRRVTDLLAGLVDCPRAIADCERHPWRGCLAPAYSPSIRDEARHHLGRLATCLRGVQEATTALHGLGFCEADPNVVEWRRAVKAARDTLSCPMVPAAWFGADPRAVADAVIQLDKLSRTCHQQVASLADFAPEKIKRAAPDYLVSMASELRELGSIRASSEDTFRMLEGRLARKRSKFVEVERQAKAAERQAKAVAELLQTPALCASVKGLDRLEELAALLARLGPVRPSWWKADQRREMLAVFARCEDQIRAASDSRSELLERLSLQAFAPENAGAVGRAAGYRWVFARLLPAWRSFKAQAAGWYGGKAPKASVLLDDMAMVSAYHRIVEECRQAQEHYAVDLLFADDGAPDWGGTMEGLKLLGRLGELVPNLFAALRGPLTGSEVRRQDLASSACDLGGKIADLRQRLKDTPRGSELVDSSLGELSARLRAEEEASTRKAALLGRLTSLLGDGKDPRIEGLSAQVKSLAELGKSRTDFAELLRRVFSVSTESQQREWQNWSDMRQKAESLLRLMHAYHLKPLPLPVVRAITMPEIRDQLTEAVKVNETACAVGFEESWKVLAELFILSQPVSTGITITNAPLPELCRWLVERAEDAPLLFEWLRFREIELRAAQEGVTLVVEEVLREQVRPEDAADAFRARFLGLWLAATCQAVPTLRGFSTDSHERLIQSFKNLDRQSVESAVARIRAFQFSRPERPRAGADEAPESSEVGILQREANKSRSRRSLREVFAAIPNVLLDLKPCVMMSPLAVSTYLTSTAIRFDLVIFDEASQVRPHDAIAAICRGRQLVVAGDQKQLPPTTFFDRALDDEGAMSEDDAIEDYDSILDLCCSLGLSRRRLRWHYRSRREGLIAFSNKYFYGNELVTFPSPDDVAGEAAVAFEYLAEGRWKAGTGGGFNAVEANRTAELVLDHFRRRPEESLGVIAFSQKQQERILDSLERLRKDCPELEGCFQEDRDEPFFVKNLENVQGDEREAIILGVGYGPTEEGKLLMNFGPLNKKNGERRLNVAVTRARRRVTVVSSMRASDIDLSKTSARGPELLKAYLDYAERGPDALHGAITGGREDKFDSPFEQEVCEELRRADMTVYSQVGCGGYKIDLAVADPTAPGRYLLGVECDGATYHSSHTARDRDRLRQEVLEGLGWRICRIWSTDWWRDRKSQVKRVQDALEKAKCEKPPQPPKPPPADAPVREDAKPVATEPDLPDYKNIGDVPEAVLREALCGMLRAYGSTEEKDLIRNVTCKLGFKKTGRLIRERIEQTLTALIEAGEVARPTDGRVQLASKAAGV